MCIFNAIYLVQRNCLYFALTAKPVPQYSAKFDCHRKFHDWIVPYLDHWLFKGIILAALIANSILLACQVRTVINSACKDVYVPYIATGLEGLCQEVPSPCLRLKAPPPTIPRDFGLARTFECHPPPQFKAKV